MKNKILTICNLEDTLAKKYQAQMEYIPLSNDKTDTLWENLIRRYQPTSIVFGLQTINEEKLSLWRQIQPMDALKFVRKGTSLHRVDFAAANKYSIQILNTPGINAPYVAEFICNLLLKNSKKPSTIAVLGIGDIGKKVVTTLLEAQMQVLLYNRSVYQFEEHTYSYSYELHKIFQTANKVAICLPLNDETNGIITNEHILNLPQNAQVICISPPRVMSAAAIVALDMRKDIHVIFDHVASGLSFIHNALGRTHLRDGFIFDEVAAAGHDCQYAMGEAAILKALK